MITDIKLEFYIFLNSVYAGLVSGIIFDLYRIIRYFYKPKKVVTLIEDLLFWIGIGLIFFYILNKSNWGQLRGYVFIGFFLGGIIYLNILSKALYPIFLRIFRRIGVIIRVTVRILKFPFTKVKKGLSPSMAKMRKIKRIPKEAVREILRLRKIISQKK
jgi:spore cortex biosynthesis protein YabQ